MNIKKYMIMLLSVFIFTALTACAENSSEYRILTPDAAVFSAENNIYKNGAVYLSPTQQVYFFDFESMQGVPLCNKPDCTHKLDNCLSNTCGNTPIIYNDYIFFFESENEIVDSEDKKSQSCRVYSKCKRASIDTGEIQTFAEFEGVDPTACYRYVINDKILYLIGAYSAYQWNDGTWSYSSNGGKQYLCSIDLESGKFNNYGLVNDSPYAENNIVIEGGSRNSVSDQVIISGIYNKKIYMYYQCVENQQDLIDVLHDSQGDLENDVPWIYENKCFDIETKEITVSDLPKAEDINENTYLYWNDTKDTYALLNEKETEIIVSGFEKIWRPHIINGKIWNFSEKTHCFDIDSEALYEMINNKYTANDTQILAYLKGKYILQYSSNNSQVFESVTESDLLGDTNGGKNEDIFM